MCTTSDEILHTLVHDLRQPLGNLETSLFYLDMVLDQPSDRIRDQMRLMERQIAQAMQLLHRAGEELRAARAQRVEAEGAVEHLTFTKSASAALS
jgi:hypothetical protein